MNLLETVAGEILSGIANSGLALDPRTQAELAALDGATLRLEIVLPPQAIVIRVEGGALRIQPGSPATAQTVIRGSINDLLALLRGQQPSARLEVSGDPALLTRFEALLRSYRPDFDALVPEQSPFTSASASSGATPGPAAFAEQLLGFVEEGLDSARRAATGVARQTQSELDARMQATLMTRSDVERLETAIDDLRLAVDRLEARARNAPRKSAGVGRSEPKGTADP
ncbi:MAG: SCP2 sterol-binding domain-containing protein [Pseudomonadota bacterium]